MIAFNKYYNHFNILSITLVVISLLLLTFKGLNFGIDFKGGTLIELRSTDSKINVSSLRENLNEMNLGDISVKNFGNKTDFLIKFENSNNKNVIEEIKSNLDKSYGNNFDFRRVENVGPKVSAELLKSGVIAISVALALMLIYIWIRFEWQFSLGAITALFHDVLVTLGLFSLLGIEINL
jgi:preprotein translocase subunit SecF